MKEKFLGKLTTVVGEPMNCFSSWRARILEHMIEFKYYRVRNERMNKGLVSEKHPQCNEAKMWEYTTHYLVIGGIK